MPKVYVYDSYDNKFFRYTLRENDPMPYSTDTTLRVREFRGFSKSNVLWTTTAAMEAWNLTRRTYGSGIPVGYAFKRIWEGGHGTTSQHYAGVAFDVGQSSTAANRRKIYNAAVRTGAWGYVEPLSMTPTWVHFDRRYGKPACRSTTAGYPTVRRGSRNTYVLILQDALNALGYSTNTLDLRPCDGERAQGVPAAVWPDCRRRMRLRQLEKDRRGDGGDRQNGDGY
jgi:hypothetical protein